MTPERSRRSSPASSPTRPSRAGSSIVVENVTEFADSDAERPLKELFQAINRSDHFLMGDGDVSQLGSGYGFIGDFKGGRRGIVLKPDTYDGDSLFKVPFPKVQRHEFPEGPRTVRRERPGRHRAAAARRRVTEGGESSPFARSRDCLP